MALESSIGSIGSDLGDPVPPGHVVVHLPSREVIDAVRTKPGWVLMASPVEWVQCEYRVEKRA